ncbi:P1 family peptidase [Eggerthellaceae bacterium 3-80]|nr:peptidase S58 family protein [bacterium D16-34]
MITSAPLSALHGFGIGHAQVEDALSGCTAIVCPQGATGGVDVRGGAPATRETDLLKPENMVQQIHAIMLSGGSAYGLACADGAMKALAENGIGFELAGSVVPIVPAACIFDLPLCAGQPPCAQTGYDACINALSSLDNPSALDALAQGNVGAGTGATVGKFAEPYRAMKSGFGWSCLQYGELICAALVTVNALGNVRNAQGAWISGVRDNNGDVINPLETFMAGQAYMSAAEQTPTSNTTLGVVLTNASLTKAQATKVSAQVHDAYARAIMPVHTLNDGDAIFTLSSNEIPATPDAVGALANQAMQEAIVNAVTHAKGVFGIPAANELPDPPVNPLMNS